MNTSYRILDATKAGNQRAEMEDAACPGHAAVVPLTQFACAVSDGATQGSHSGPWARFLCEEYVTMAKAAPAADGLDAVVAQARHRFQQWEQDYLSDRAALGRPLQWFEEAVVGSGAFATLVGVRLDAASDGKTAALKAVAIGDSCLFVVRQRKIASSFPLTDSTQFSGAPLLIASLAASNANMQGGVRELEGELVEGDGIFLCTDALAAWIMREMERGVDPTARLLTLLDEGNLDAFLAALRQQRQLRNDDVTLAYLELKA